MILQAEADVGQEDGEVRLCEGDCKLCNQSDADLIAFYASDHFNVLFVLLVGAHLIDEEYEALFLEIFEHDMSEVDELIARLLHQK